MDTILKILPITLYFIVGVISLIMAFKNILSGKFLPFHEKAAGVLWDNIEDPLRQVILSLLRLAGLGFFVIALSLIIFPAVNYFKPDKIYKYSIPFLALLYCTGLFIINYSLYKKTRAVTPWKGSLYAALLIIAGLVISIF